MTLYLSQEQDISVVALLRYADSCPPETLHPDCPYSMQDGAGGRTCETQCRTIISNLVRPNHAAPTPAGFDAGQALVEARVITPDPCVLWPTSALVTVLQKVARSDAMPRRRGGLLRREIEGTSALAILAQRGLDIDALLRHGVGDALASAIGVALAVAKSQPGEAVPPRLEAWTAFACRCGLTDASDFLGARADPRFRRALDRWVAVTSPANVLAWSPPEFHDDLLDVPDPDPALAAEYRWFVARLTTTYLSDWPSQALHLEYRLASGSWKPEHVPLTLVRERSETAEVVARAIAERAVSANGGRNRTETLHTLTEQAASYINSDRADLAATAFGTARSIEPGNPEYANNHGFCLIPQDPDEALVALLEARHLGKDDAVNRANAALVFKRLGRPLEALLELAGALQTGVLRTPNVTAYLWIEERDGELSMENTQIAKYVCKLGQSISRDTENESEEAAWRTRLVSLDGPPQATEGQDANP